MKILKYELGAMAMTSNGRAESRQADQLKSSGSPSMDLLTFGEEFIGGRSNSNVVAVVTSNRGSSDVELGSSGCMHGYMVTLGGGVVPLKVAGFVISVHIKLGRER
jgi:hypothetical protein